MAPGSWVRRAASASASARAWVDLPHPSMPSSAMRRPRAGTSEGFGRCGLHGRRPVAGCLLGGRRLLRRPFFAAPFFAVAFFAVDFFLAGAAFLAAFLFLAGPAARRSASSSEARSMVMDSTASPLRRLALVVPSVT